MTAGPYRRPSGRRSGRSGRSAQDAWVASIVRTAHSTSPAPAAAPVSASRVFVGVALAFLLVLSLCFMPMSWASAEGEDAQAATQPATDASGYNDDAAIETLSADGDDGAALDEAAISLLGAVNLFDIADVAVPLVELTYSDVPEGKWFYENIRYVTQNGLMDAMTARGFEPYAATTRAVLVQALYRLEGSPIVGTPKFPDVAANAPYAQAVAWASENGIVNGDGKTGKFLPTDPVTRQQLAAILHRYVKFKNADDGARADLSVFPDNGTLANYAREAFAWCNAKGIVNGVNGTELQPGGTASRAQMAAILNRYCVNVLGIQSVRAMNAGNSDQRFAEDGSTTSGPSFAAPGQVALASVSTSRAQSSNGASIDVSHASEGYVSAWATNNNRLKLQLVNGGTSYNYDLPGNGTPIVVPLNMGNGSYKVRVMQNTSGSKYVEIHAVTVNVSLSSEFAPYTRPNMFCNYTAASTCVAKAREITANAKNQGAAVRAVYNWVTSNVTYDRAKAAKLSNSTGYVPNPDETLATGKGICFDYASLSAAMLRSLGIPCKVITGYVSPGNLYHAWNLVYIDGQWVSVAIEVDANTWTRIDTTFAAGAAATYTGDGTSYADRYVY